MQFQLKEHKVNSLLSILSITFAVVVFILLCIVLISSNNFRTLPYKESYDAIMVISYFLSWIFAIIAVFRIVKYKNQKEGYLAFGIFGFIGLIIVLRLEDNDKAKHDKERNLVKKESKTSNAPSRAPVANDDDDDEEEQEPVYKQSPARTPKAPAPPREEIINAKSIQVVTTDGKIYNIKTGDGEGGTMSSSMTSNNDQADSDEAEEEKRPSPSFNRPSPSTGSAPVSSPPKAVAAKPTILGKFGNKIKSYLPKNPFPKLPAIPIPKVLKGIKVKNWGKWFKIPRLRLKPLSKQVYMDDAVFSLDPKSRLQKGSYIRKSRIQDNLDVPETRYRSMRKQQNIWGTDNSEEEE